MAVFMFYIGVFAIGFSVIAAIGEIINYFMW